MSKSGLSANRPSRHAGTPASTSAYLNGDRPPARVNFQVPADLHASFKSAVAADGTTIKDVLTDFMHRYLNGER